MKITKINGENMAVGNQKKSKTEILIFSINWRTCNEEKDVKQEIKNSELYDFEKKTLFKSG